MESADGAGGVIEEVKIDDGEGRGEVGDGNVELDLPCRACNRLPVAAA